MNVTDTKYSAYIRFRVEYDVVSYEFSQVDNASLAELLPLSEVTSISEASAVAS